MRSKELDAAIAIFRRLSASTEAEHVHQQSLRRALRELETLRQGGKTDARRVGVAVEAVSKILEEIFLCK